MFFGKKKRTQILLECLVLTWTRTIFLKLLVKLYVCHFTLLFFGINFLIQKLLALEELEALCFEFGMEVEEFKEMAEEESQSKKKKKNVKVEQEPKTLLKFEVAANRYDILCEEGLVRALKIFREKISLPKYELSNPNQEPTIQITVKQEVLYYNNFEKLVH